VAVNLLKEILKPIIPQSLVRAVLPRVMQKKAGKYGVTLVIRDRFLDLEKGNKTLRLSRAHAVYLSDMIENFDFYVDSVIPVDGDKVLVDMSAPGYHRLKGFGDVSFMFPSLTEPYATTEQYLEFAKLKEGDVVIDVGAYAGVTSIIFAQLVGPSGHVYAFEADEANYACAKTNIEMAEKKMGLRNITLIRKAIWSHNNGLLFSHEGAMGSGAAETVRRRAVQTVVPSITLAQFLKEQGLKDVDFIKVDIEGGEVALLESSQEFLKSSKVRMIIEPHIVKGRLNADRCCQLLESAGHSAYIREQIGAAVPLIEAVKA
jgi:FkbM family methyltransferase